MKKQSKQSVPTAKTPTREQIERIDRAAKAYQALTDEQQRKQVRNKGKTGVRLTGETAELLEAIADSRHITAMDVLNEMIARDLGVQNIREKGGAR